MKLAFVEWRDASGLPDRLQGWTALDDIRGHCRPVVIRSVGWIVADEPQRLVIVPNLTDDGYGESPTAIPRAWIRRIVRLKEPA